MRFAARIHNSAGDHRLDVSAGTNSSVISIAPKTSGFGSSVSGGEMLMAALATCYCNDVYREARSMGIEVTGIDVECEADFPAEGAPAENVKYAARITARATEDRIRELARRADTRAEIQNTLRQAVAVALTRVETQTV